MGLAQVRGPDGKYHLVNIAGDSPTEEEQLIVDGIGAGTYTPPTPTTAGAVAAQTPQQQLASEAATQRRSLAGQAANYRNNTTLVTGLAGAAAGGAIGGLPGALVGAAGTLAGPYLGQYDFEGSVGAHGAKSKELRDFIGLTDDELRNEALGGAAFDLGANALGTVAGKGAKAVLGLSNRADLINEIDTAAEVGIRLTGGDLARDWIHTARKVTSIVPLLAAGSRRAETNRAREIADAVNRLRGPLDPLFTEATGSAELLAAASRNFNNSVPWYKLFYEEAENYAKQNNLRFDASGAIQAAEEFAQSVERGRRVINRTTQRTATTTTERATQRSKQVLQSGKTLEGTITETDPGGTITSSRVGPESRSLTTTPGEAGILSEETNVSKVASQAITTKTERGLSRTYSDAADVAALLDEIRYYDPNFDFYQYDALTKEIGDAWGAASKTQKIQLTRVKQALEESAKATADPKFNFLYQNARDNFGTLKEFFSNPQARKFQLVDADVFDTAFVGHAGNAEKREVSHLFGSLFDPKLGPDGVRHIAGLVHPPTMDKAVRLNVRQRLDKFILNPGAESGKIDWDGLRMEFGLNDPTSLRYETFNEMLKHSKYGMNAEQFAKALNTIEGAVGDKLPALSTQLIRSASLGGLRAPMRNFSAARLFNIGGSSLSNKVGTLASQLLATVGLVGTVTGVRSLGNFLADPDKLRVMLKYIDEGAVPTPGTSVPGLIPGTSFEVGGGARQTYLATMKPVKRGLQVQMVRWLAQDIANKTSTTSSDAKFLAQQLEQQFNYVLEHPEETKNMLQDAGEQQLGTAEQLFRNYIQTPKPTQ